jgi:hypothetical protein
VVHGLLLADGVGLGVAQLVLEAVGPGPRMDLPQALVGLRKEKLASVTGVMDVRRCHTDLFIGWF